eukprot:TRINITY_DN11745_c0_g7_i2.p1 TRINITY_DN11745_c0_g7~~TRINITY_DN11745_c0_g7_i2.p1  ORF type:complete len:992 (+),score=176.41 TRINITY_DN11745_c0_g7_i2:1390-4365(+)
MAASTIDDSLYSRQRYVLGDDVMLRMKDSAMIIFGLSGLGIETAKNIALAGVGTLIIIDDTPCTIQDLGTNFFIDNAAVEARMTRAIACQTHLQSLNPYVKVQVQSESFIEQDALATIQLLIITSGSLSHHVTLNELCRKSDTKFLSARVHGAFAYCFADFGEEFTVLDARVEEKEEVIIVQQAHDGTYITDQAHDLSTGEAVQFTGDTTYDAVVATTPTRQSFTIDTRPASELIGASVKTRAVPRTMHHQSLTKQMSNPTMVVSDYARPDEGMVLLQCLQALDRFQKEAGRAPDAGSEEDWVQYQTLLRQLDRKSEAHQQLARKFFVSQSGQLPPLNAAIGGMVAQEAIKCLGRRFLPLQQWMWISMPELVDLDIDSRQRVPCNDRYDAVRAVIGEDTLGQAQQCSIFMVGCGAIGCELLKNFALLGACSQAQATLTVTDDDVIEKSNLNRQFLFRPEDVGAFKADCAAKATKVINSAVTAEVYKERVQPKSRFNEEFVARQDAIFTALDNLEARRHVDALCVASQRPLFESGTMGTKGHTQVIIPHLTENYTHQSDPNTRQVPYCTLKSFPSKIENTIQWARDKFASLFEVKPAELAQILSAHGGVSGILKYEAINGKPASNAAAVVKLLQKRPSSMQDCIGRARIAFEKYFNHKAQRLLHMFPPEHRSDDGELFWRPPKRMPTPLTFDGRDPLHLAFIRAFARLWARIFSIQYVQENLSDDALFTSLRGVAPPSFVYDRKIIVTDERLSVEAAKQKEAEQATSSSAMLSPHLKGVKDLRVQPLEFEKDDDENGHIDFITATSNLRATMYGIAPVDRVKTKQVAGNIIPAIATTTACVAGLVVCEWLKYLSQPPTAAYRNCFLNLALPLMVFSEPLACPRHSFQGHTYSLWQPLALRGSPDMTLQELLASIKAKFKVEADSVMKPDGTIVYDPVLNAGHRKRLKKSLVKLLKLRNAKQTDLVLAFDELASHALEAQQPLFRLMLTPSSP